MTWGTQPYFEQKCTKTPGCYLGPFHYGVCLTYTVPNVQTVYPIGYQELLNENYRLTLENLELKKSAARAKELWNEETQSYQIPLSKPGRIEYLDNEGPQPGDEDEVRAYEAKDYPTNGNTATYEVKLDANRPGKPGSFSWGPQSKQDYEATEEYRRSGYGEYVRAKRVQRLEMVTIFEVDLDSDADVWQTVETGKAVESSLRILED